MKKEKGPSGVWSGRLKSNDLGEPEGQSSIKQNEKARVK